VDVVKQGAESCALPSQFDWGEHPIDFSGHGSHSIPIFMSTREMTQAVFGEASRSDFYHFVTPVLPRNRAPEVGFDILGGVIVVSLSMGVVFLMRLILAN
jgi:hypothetical protein